MEKLVSIIIPTYKGQDVILKCVESVLNQTYKNIEVIVVDDNGKNSEEQQNTERVLYQYIKQHKIKYITHDQNKNGSAARNTGIKNSKGEYIAFLDDDDYFYVDKIEKQVNALERAEKKVGINYCSAEIKFLTGTSEIKHASLSGKVLYEFLSGKISIGSSRIMIKRNVLNKVDGFDETFKRHQDWEFIARILNYYELDALDEVLIVKHKIDRNKPNPINFEKYRIYYLDKMKEYINKFNFQEKRNIYNHHYGNIGKEYFKSKKIFKCIYWTFKCSNPLNTFLSYIKDGINFLKTYKKS